MRKAIWKKEAATGSLFFVDAVSNIKNEENPTSDFIRDTPSVML